MDHVNTAQMCNDSIVENEQAKGLPRPGRVRELRKQIEELKKRWPAHSTPPALLQQLDELEEELEEALKTGEGVQR